MSVYKGSQKQSEIYKGLKYYKYESWTQPTLSSDTSYGTISSSITTWGDGQAWHISDGVKGTSNKWGGGSGSGNITWHLSEKIKINSFQVWQTNESGYLNRFPKTIKLYASDDGTNYTEVGSLSGYSQPASAGYVTVTCNTSKVYEYYKWEFGTSWKGSEIAVSEIVITAQKVVAGTSSSYDYTEPQKIREIYKGSELVYSSISGPRFQLYGYSGNASDHGSVSKTLLIGGMTLGNPYCNNTYISGSELSFNSTITNISGTLGQSGSQISAAGISNYSYYGTYQVDSINLYFYLKSDTFYWGAWVMEGSTVGSTCLNIWLANSYSFGYPTAASESSCTTYVFNDQYTFTRDSSLDCIWTLEGIR